MQKSIQILLPLVLLLLSGCTQESSPQAKPTALAESSSPVVNLSVLVLDDPQLAHGIKLLRGEWSERSGGELTVYEGTTGAIGSEESLNGDLVVFPSHQLGFFVLNSQLRPVRASVLASEAFNQKDLFPIIRNRVLPFGDKVYAVSLGEAPLGIGSMQSEFLDRWGFEEARSKQVQVSSAVKYPHAIKLIVRAIGYASQGGRSALLFDPNDMRPRINTPPFHRALEEIQPSKSSLAESEGQETLFLTYPQCIAKDFGKKARVFFHPIPSTSESYNFMRDTWELAESTSPIVVLGLSGRSIAVTRASRNASSAFKLLQWLATRETAIQLSQESTATIWFRRSHVPEASTWLEEGILDDQAIDTVTQLLSLPADKSYLVPRIPAIESYLEVLEAAVIESRRVGKDSQKVLQEVADDWDRITERQGEERQRTAYRMHLGL